MNEMKVFEEQVVLGKEFKIYGSVEEPLFLAKDVADWIEHTHTTNMLKSVDDNEKLNVTILHAGQNREVTMLTEDGLYEVLMQSRKPIAKAFKKEVKQILKSIRKNGAYMTPETLEKAIGDIDFTIGLLSNLKEEQNKRKQLELKVEEDRPKVEFANAVSSSENSISVGDMAKILKQNGIDIGSKRLFAWLRDNGYLIKKKGSTDYNSPTQKSMDLGLFDVKITTIQHINGSTIVQKTSKVTGKGQLYFVNKFNKNQKAAL